MKHLPDFYDYLHYRPLHCTKVRFASFFSGGFTNTAVMNLPEKKLEKRTSVHWMVGEKWTLLTVFLFQQLNVMYQSTDYGRPERK
jgi:hypothetical protein